MYSLEGTWGSEVWFLFHTWAAATLLEDLVAAQELEERTGETRACNRELIPCRSTQHGACERSRCLHLAHQQGERNMPSNEYKANETGILLSQPTAGLCGHSFVFSILFPYTASPHKLLLWMESELAKAFANSCSAKCQYFCTSACFQLPTPFAKCIRPTPACDFSCVVDTDCSGK